MRNSKRNVSKQMAKLKAQTNHRMDNNCHIPNLVQAFFYVKKWWIEPIFIAS